MKKSQNNVLSCFVVVVNFSRYSYQTCFLSLRRISFLRYFLLFVNLFFIFEAYFRTKWIQKDNVICKFTWRNFFKRSFTQNKFLKDVKIVDVKSTGSDVYRDIIIYSCHLNYSVGLCTCTCILISKLSKADFIGLPYFSRSPSGLKSHVLISHDYLSQSKLVPLPWDRAVICLGPASKYQKKFCFVSKQACIYCIRSEDLL